MLKRRFNWVDHHSFGPGWVPSWIDNADPVQGFGAAHDALEHFPKCIGGFEGEMMAFGAMHMVRSEKDWLNSKDIYEAQASDLTTFLRAVIDGDQTLRDPGAYSLDGLTYTDPERCLEGIRMGILGACKEMAGYRSDREGNYGRSDLASFRRALPIDVDKRILGWMIKGARKAEKRFAQWDIPGWRLTELFNEVEEQFDQCAKRSGDFGEFIDVRVNFMERHVSVVRDYTDE